MSIGAVSAFVLGHLALMFFFGFCSASRFCSWAGLRLADRAELPMPLLRAWEEGASTPNDALRQILVPRFSGGLPPAF